MSTANSPKANIAALRRQMAEKGLAAYIIPATDPHMSEYLPDHWRALRWASGFSGSAGTLVVTTDFAGVWTDSRYFIQAEAELAGSGVELVKLNIPHTPEYLDWLAGHLPEGAKVGTDGDIMSRALYKLLESKMAAGGIRVDPHVDLVGPAWGDRPTLPLTPVYEHPVKYAGASRKDKLARVRAALTDKKATHTILSTLDDIAWALNLRGADVPYNPVFVAHAAIGPREAILFVNPAKVPAELQSRLKRDGVQLRPYEDITAYLGKLPASATVLIDPRRISQNLPGAIPPSVAVVEDTNVTTWLKACKTPAEAAHTRQTMIKDGVVLTKFFYWLSQTVGRQRVTEWSAAAKLHELRRQQAGNISESFGTISAYGPHSAMPHYNPAPEREVELKPSGLYLLDSGGQYLGGTTDTTRVISLGNITEEERTDYTLVLQGLIAVCRLRFPKGTKGSQIDAIARTPQWVRGINFGHGTGHGVGYFLNVHEGPQGISPAAVTPESAQLPGMITSVEPGIYRAGKHGVRIENLVLCVEDENNEFGEFLAFEVLTLAPIFTNLVQKNMLHRDELAWLKNYNNLVYKKIARYLTPEEKAWVRGATRI